MASAIDWEKEEKARNDRLYGKPILVDGDMELSQDTLIAYSPLKIKVQGVQNLNKSLTAKYDYYINSISKCPKQPKNLDQLLQIVQAEINGENV